MWKICRSSEYKQWCTHFLQCRLWVSWLPMGSSVWTEWSDLHLSLSRRLQFHSWHRTEYGEQLSLTVDLQIIITCVWVSFLSFFSFACVCQTFLHCACVQSWGMSAGNSSAALGQCSRESRCAIMFYIYLALQSLAFFVFSLGTVPFFIISLRFCLITLQHILQWMINHNYMFYIYVLYGWNLY